MNDPWALLTEWEARARDHEPRVHDAFQLATVGPDGAPSLRTVLVKCATAADGLVFYTNLGSRKALELQADRRVAGLWHWKSLAQQVHVEGTAEPLPSAEADAYWSTRPRGSQVGAWASRQSAPLASPAELAGSVAETEARFPDAVPRPEFWGGFRIRPHRFEFWQGRLDRLHERTEFVRDGAIWRNRLLYP